jgi:hypothetical protein
MDFLLPGIPIRIFRRRQLEFKELALPDVPKLWSDRVNWPQQPPARRSVVLRTTSIRDRSLFRVCYSSFINPGAYYSISQCNLAVGPVTRN